MKLKTSGAQYFQQNICKQTVMTILRNGQRTWISSIIYDFLELGPLYVLIFIAGQQIGQWFAWIKIILRHFLHNELFST